MVELFGWNDPGFQSFFKRDINVPENERIVLSAGSKSSSSSSSSRNKSNFQRNNLKKAGANNPNNNNSTFSDSDSDSDSESESEKYDAKNGFSDETKSVFGVYDPLTNKMWRQHFDFVKSKKMLKPIVLITPCDKTNSECWIMGLIVKNKKIVFKDFFKAQAKELNVYDYEFQNERERDQKNQKKEKKEKKIELNQIKQVAEIKRLQKQVGAPILIPPFINYMYQNIDKNWSKKLVMMTKSATMCPYMTIGYLVSNFSKKKENQFGNDKIEILAIVTAGLLTFRCKTQDFIEGSYLLRHDILPIYISNRYQFHVDNYISKKKFVELLS